MQQPQQGTIPYPGVTEEMPQSPCDEMRCYEGRDLLAGKKALITGGDSGIGRAVAIALAKEGADVAIAHLDEREADDAAHTRRLVSDTGQRCHVYRSDLSNAANCLDVVDRAVNDLDGLDILVNNAAFQSPVDDFLDIAPEQWELTFRINIDSYFHITRAALPHLPRGGSIINTGSVNGLRGNRQLIDYSATKGAVNAFTFALAQALIDDGIRVNCVAPGPVWTPLIPSTFPSDQVEDFGTQAPMGRAAQPDEIAPSYVFFASERLSSYYSGQVLAPVGGEIVPG
ncbi:putative oxidoreductase [Gordonia araii NBRC 100433]|uniref:Putative oxidoreductase n=1 Tax=Gordonia araii NBRC 100433 TaxID=1073574 RepID=G7H7J1_9ACTN|nr:SDR family oxidoreductase [Gordonia araii]NNG98499.1 SDR family oxidoreductase [Gordonia araii NBRC 100433]GAB11816.1 putative oxidoreductase [Gordonia araii NBRC 100433]